MKSTSVWYGHIMLLLCDIVLIYFFAVRYIRDRKCLDVAKVILPEYALSWLGTILVTVLEMSSPLRWIPLAVSFWHMTDNGITLIILIAGLKKHLKPDGNKTVYIRGIFSHAEAVYEDGSYASYKKQLYLALFLKLTVFFSSVLTVCYAMTTFVYFGIL